MRHCWVVAAIGVLIDVGCRDPMAAAVSSTVLPDTSLVVVPVSPPPRDTDALFQTDSLVYTLTAAAIGYQGVIGVDFGNQTGATASVPNCNGSTELHLEKMVGGVWTRVWSPAIPACESPVITIGPATHYPTSIFVFGAYPGENAEPKFSTSDITGLYRAVWDDIRSGYQSDTATGALLPMGQRVSNRFVLLLQPR
jgi:hypothetical protein